MQTKSLVRGSEPGLESAGFEAGPVRAVDELNVEPPALQFRHAGSGQGFGVVRGIVEHLDLEAVLGVIDLAYRAEKPFHHIDLVEDRQLHRNLGQLVEMTGRQNGTFPIL